jgi:alpha-beta hydrolase superfamily lysophospholipase
MHVMAKSFAAAGYAAYALDIRGHGQSGAKGHIAYIGQLEDDLEDFVHSTKLAQPSTLAGFSSGGGFVLRFAGSPRQELFSNYLLLSPWISQDAATLRPGSGGWATVGVPRIIAIAVLNGFGMHAFDDLPVVRFAVDERDKGLLTPQYSFALAQNFRPERDYQANIRAIRQTLRVLVGQNDDVSYADRFAAVFKTAGKDVPVTVLPGIDHISLTLDPVAVQAAIAAVESMDHEKPNQTMQTTAGRRTNKLPIDEASIFFKEPLIWCKRAAGARSSMKRLLVRPRASVSSIRACPWACEVNSNSYWSDQAGLSPRGQDRPGQLAS